MSWCGWERPSCARDDLAQSLRDAGSGEGAAVERRDRSQAERRSEKDLAGPGKVFRSQRRFPGTGVRLNVGVFNLGDKTYTDWADVPGVSSSSRTLDRYTRPGRSFAASVAVDW